MTNNEKITAKPFWKKSFWCGDCCDKCEVCKYLEYREYVESVAPQGESCCTEDIIIEIFVNKMIPIINSGGRKVTVNL